MTFYVRHGGKVAGPFTAVQLKSLASQGKINASTAVAKTTEGPWHRAGSVRGLFQAMDTPASASAASSLPVPHRPIEGTPVPSPSAPLPLPASIEPSFDTSTEHLLTNSPPSAATLLLFLVVGGYAVSAIAYGTSGNSGFPVDPQEWAPAVFLRFLAYAFPFPIIWVSETILLFMLWNALPDSRRPFQLRPVLIVGLMFVPLVAYGWNFVALGSLGQAWLGVAQPEKDAAEASEDKEFGWLGFALAAVLTISWLAFMLSLAGLADWWELPLVGPPDPNARFPGSSTGFRAFLRTFSLNSLALFAASFLSFMFYKGILDRWKRTLPSAANSEKA